MKTSSKLVGVLTLSLLLASQADAAGGGRTTKTIEAQKYYGNISKDDLAISASMNLSSAWAAGSSQSTTFGLGVQAQYFVVDLFALGVSGSLQTSAGTSNLRAGPVATYFFWTADRLAAFVSQNVSVQAFSSGGRTASTATLTSQFGLNYFLTPSVAVGPIAQYFHGFGTSNYIRVDQISFLGQFSIFL